MWVFFVLFGACLATFSGLGGCQRQISDARIEVITLAEAVEFFEQSKGPGASAMFLDARRDSIFALGTIEGARQLRPDDVDLRADPDPKLEAKDALVVFGQDPSSAVARAMSKRLLQAGYNSMLKARVKFYPGGYDEWLATGLPVETPRVED
jgi:rhodanese-related sulfurtransferase